MAIILWVGRATRFCDKPAAKPITHPARTNDTNTTSNKTTGTCRRRAASLLPKESIRSFKETMK